MKKLVFLWVASLAAACGGGAESGGPDVPLPDLTSEDNRPDAEVAPDTVRDTGPDTATEGAPDTVNDTGPDAAIIEGCKKQLEIGESGRALKCFEAALANWPDDTNLLFGAALAELVYGSELSIMVTSAPGQFANGDQQSQNEYLGAEFHSIFMRLRSFFVNAAQRLERIQGRDLHFEVSACPIFLGLKPTLNARGVFDDGDVLLMQAIADVVIGFYDFLAGQDFTTEVMDMIYFIKDNLSSADFKAISGVLAYLLDADTRFLTLEATDGKALFEDARERFGSAGPRLLAALDRIRELGDSANDVTFVEDTGDSVRLHFSMGVTYDSSGKPVEEPLVFELSGKVQDGLRNASESILKPGRLTTLHGGVFPVLGLIVSTVARAGVLKGLNVSLPIDIGAFEPGQLSDLLCTMMPNALAFDWGTFFTRPTGLRGWLPVWESKGGPEESRLVCEWECPEDLDASGYPSGKFRMLCGEGATLTDGPHFEGQPWKTEADGVASALPVFAFKDPTLDGLLYVNLSPTPMSDDATSYKPATTTSLNAAMGMLLSGLLPLLLK